MIGLKTSVLFAAACKLGAIIGGASEVDQKELYKFGFNLGLAFQIMDDYLDTFGDESFGKKIGGDILLNKKTYLLVSALELANEAKRKKIEGLFTEQDDQKKISQFRNLFDEMKIRELAQNKMKEHHSLSVEHLNKTGLHTARKAEIMDFAQMMLKRSK